MNRLVSGPGWIGRLLTISLMCCSVPGCFRVNEVGPEPLFEGLQSLLIEQDDGGYRAVSLCSSDPFFTDGDAMALGFRAPLRELGFSSGNRVEVGNHPLLHEPRSLAWVDEKQAWENRETTGDLGVRPAKLEVSSVACSAESLDGLSLIARTNLGSVVLNRAREYKWIDTLIDGKGQVTVRSQTIQFPIDDVAAGPVGSAWLVRNDLVAPELVTLVVDRLETRFETRIPGSASVARVAQSPNGSVVAVVTLPIHDNDQNTTTSTLTILRYDVSKEDGLGLRDAISMTIAPRHEGVLPATNTEVVSGTDGSFYGIVGRRTAFRWLGSSGSPEKLTDDGWDRATWIGQIHDGQWAWVSRVPGDDDTIITSFAMGALWRCEVGKADDVKPHVAFGRTILETQAGFLDPSRDCEFVSVDGMEVRALPVSSLMLTGEECGPGGRVFAIGPPLFGSHAAGCYNSQVTPSKLGL